MTPVDQPFQDSPSSPSFEDRLSPDESLSKRVMLARLRCGGHQSAHLENWVLARFNTGFAQGFGLNSTANPTEYYGRPFFEFLPPSEYATLQQYYSCHLLVLLLSQLLKQLQKTPSNSGELDRLQDQIRELEQIVHTPIVIQFNRPDQPPGWLQVWFNSESLNISGVHPKLDEWTVFSRQLMGDAQFEDLQWLENYSVTGELLLEGIEVTQTEQKQRLIQLLISPTSLLEGNKLQSINYQLQVLFRASHFMILNADMHQVRFLVGKACGTVETYAFPREELDNPHFVAALEQNQVLRVGEINSQSHSGCERTLWEEGVRSLLLIPLRWDYEQGGNHPEMLRLIGLISDRPHNFTAQDCRYAQELIPAFACAMRQTNHNQLNPIHPAVAWRFTQEAERRSWGFEPAPIVCEKVYPLFGISDIRSSSNERNRAIQADLIEQFKLALAILEAVEAYQENRFVRQIKIDLETYKKRIEEKVTVDSEVTAVQYLQDHFEIYFDYFCQCGELAQKAVKYYRQCSDNDRHSVDTARQAYDRTIDRINETLLKTWERWQQRMQGIIPHYCDLEATDGIDHMIYVGKSIHHSFTPFHLHSLRYEQLCAMCDAARTGIELHEVDNIPLLLTHLVLVQDVTIDIFHDENTEKIFDVQGSRDTRYEIVKKRIDKGVDLETGDRITAPGMLTLVYSTDDEWKEYEHYLDYLQREGWIAPEILSGSVAPLQGVDGLRYARVQVLPE
ncbi:hypothetical protein [Roseofilum capinflatum]|uniref:GAF domain-containing protein n=1 Tax=Roseofilum capinflatum BLCC-M114 TaxID=3022440 RepID=A0ABT7B084_9CYAN|nr:hypothetical protein [Roseofilum capinflatum]MDJ1172541.1 GAF domain-containing protein [Roseofilum capinflatum BLCC-M114]